MDQSNFSEVELTERDLLNSFKKPVPPDYFEKMESFAER